MRIWLVDTIDITQENFEGIEFTHTNMLDTAFLVGGSISLNDLPDPVEHDLIIVDVMNSRANHFYDMQKRKQQHEKQTGVPQRKSLAYAPVLANETGYEFQLSRQHLTNKLKDAVQYGKTVVIIAGEYVDLNSRNSYDWFCDLFEAKKKSIRPSIGPSSLTLASSDDSLRYLYEKYGDDLSWEVSFELFERQIAFQDIAAAFGLTKKNKSAFSVPEPISFFHNKRDELVSFSVRTNGEYIVLPNVEDTAKREDYLKYLISTFLPIYRPSLFPERWSANYLPRSLSHKKNALELRRTRILNLISKREKRLEEESGLVRNYMDLITQIGERLVIATATAFRDVFGFHVRDIDAERKGISKRFDLLISFGTFTASIEVKGGKRTVNTDYIQQTQKNVELYLKEHSKIDSFSANVLLVNHQSHLSPENRNDISEDRIVEAEEKGITILTTDVFLELIYLFASHKIDVDYLIRKLSTPGIVLLEE